MTATQMCMDGQTLLNVVAAALHDLARQETTPDSVYSAEVVTALNQLVLSAISDGVAPPNSIPDVVRWAAYRPLGQWPIELPAELGMSGKFLVDAETRELTSLCHELLRFSDNVAARRFDESIMQEVFGSASAGNKQAVYEEFHRVFIERPVMTKHQLMNIFDEFPYLFHHTATVNKCYLRAPSACRGSSGEFVACSVCRCLMKPIRDKWVCHSHRCSIEQASEAGHRYVGTEAEDLWLLEGPLRQWITSPGVVELQIEQTALDAGCQVQMWPQLDAYDVHITLPTGTVWAVDAKDWAVPQYLASSITPIPDEPEHDRAFFVVPQYRFNQHRDYAHVFHATRKSKELPPVTLLSDRVFERKLREAAAGQASRDSI